MAHLTEYGSWAAERAHQDARAARRANDTRTQGERTRDAIMRVAIVAGVVLVAVLLAWRP